MTALDNRLKQTVDEPQLSPEEQRVVAEFFRLLAAWNTTDPSPGNEDVRPKEGP